MTETSTKYPDLWHEWEQDDKRFEYSEEYKIETAMKKDIKMMTLLAMDTNK